MPDSMLLSDQFSNNFALIKQVLRPPLRINDRRAMRLYSEMMINRCEDIFISDRSGDDLAGCSIRDPDRLSASQTASCQKRRAHLRPVIPATVLRINSRCTSKLAPDNKQRVVQLTSLFEIQD